MPSLALKASINYPFVGPSGPSYDPDASAWFSAVEATGANFGASPESISSNKTAFNTAFLSLKSNGIWSSIRQACFLVGPSTLAGALVNIKLTGNPVNYNFTSAYYNKLTGLIGDTSGSGNTNRYLDTLLNDSTDIDGLNFHMFVDTINPNSVPGSTEEAVFGSNNDGGEIGANIYISEKSSGYIMYPNSWESINFQQGNKAFSRDGDNVTYNNGILGWGSYYTEYADYWSGNNFLLFKTNGNSSANNRLYNGRISFYSLGSNASNMESFVDIVNTLRLSLVN